MAGYSRITCYIPGFENASSEEELRSLYSAFLHDFYDSDAPDADYPVTLERYGLGHGKSKFVNVEALDVAACVAALTLMVSADRLGDGFGEPKACISDIGLFLRLLRRIAELDGTWQRPNVVTFYHEGEENGYLSNWYEAPFEFAGITFPTAEHWMMWHKARLFRDFDTAERILASGDLDEVKDLGKQVKPYADELWEEVRVPIMRVGLRQKFLQNERLYHELLSTGMAALAEAAANDATWGIGIAADDPKVADPGQWRGRNLLGITLMAVRSDLRAACTRAARPTWSMDDLRQSQLWDMSLLELARVPSCRPAAIMYATYAAFAVPSYHGAHDALRKIDATVGEIDESMRLNMGGGLPIDGWAELMDELAFQASLTRTEAGPEDGGGSRTRGGLAGSRRIDVDALNAFADCAKEAAISGDSEALCRLADMYAEGEIVDRDLSAAAGLYRRSLEAATGIAEQARPALSLAGLLVGSDDADSGVAHVLTEALELYQLAERGFREGVVGGRDDRRDLLRRAIGGQEYVRELLDGPMEYAHADRGSDGEGRESGDAVEAKAAAPRGLADAVWGAAVGDALGVPYEFERRDTFACTDMVGHGSHNQPAGTWSDDTAMLIATCDSVRRLGRVDAADLLESFRRWYDEGAYTPDGVVFDIGNTTRQALNAGYGATDEWSNGNGSLMRIAPLAFCGATDGEVRAASAVTHAHPTSTEACVEFVHLLRDAATDAEGTRARLRKKLAGMGRDKVSSGGYVLDTLTAATWCFANTDNYRDCVLAAVNLGRDTDTTACVAGALAGAAYGLESIPGEWMDRMRGREVLESTLF